MRLMARSASGSRSARSSATSASAAPSATASTSRPDLALFALRQRDGVRADRFQILREIDGSRRLHGTTRSNGGISPGHQLRARREAMGLTQDQLAKRLGTSPAEIRMFGTEIEKDPAPPPHAGGRDARAFPPVVSGGKPGGILRGAAQPGKPRSHAVSRHARTPTH